MDLRRDVGQAKLSHVLAKARVRSYTRPSLETGSQPFDPTVDNLTSVFMTKALGHDSGGV